MNVLGPFRYGAVASIAGPGFWPASTSRFMLRSMKPFTFPPVLIRGHATGKVKPRKAFAELTVHARSSRVVEVLVHHDQSGNDAFAAQVDDGRAVRHGHA